MSYSVIVLSRNSWNLYACVGSVREREERYVRVIHVDDGCTDLLAGVETVAGIKPFCFSRNANLGIAAAGRDDVVLLNDDALLETGGGFSLLESAAKERPEYGLIAASCNNVGNRNQLRVGNGLRDEPRMVCFVCVYIPRATIDAVGLLDEGFKGYGMEDDDYCLRVRNAGLKIAVHDGCFVDHSKLHSSFRGPAGNGGDYRPNLEIFKAKWGHDNWGRPA